VRPENPEELLKRVADEKSFVAFVRALAEDWADEQRKEARLPSSPYEAGANGWENGSIGAFLGAAVAWAEVSEADTAAHTLPRNAWRRCADILYMGKVYE
jgi:hypothetical protein